MLNNNQKVSMEPIFLIQLFLLLILNTMHRSSYDILKNIGDISINLSLFVMYIYLVKGILEKSSTNINYIKLYVTLFAMILFNSISFLANSNTNNFFLIKLILLLLFIVGAVRMKWTPQIIKSFAYLLCIFFLFIFIHWVQLDFPTRRFRSIFQNPNYLAILLFTMLYFKVIALKFSRKWERLYFLIMISVNLLLIFHTNSRTVLMCIFLVLTGWVVLKKIPMIFPYLLYITLSINLFFLFVYIKIQNTNVGIALNELSRNIFGKSFYSGRSELWSSILDSVYSKPFFGFGLGTNAKDIIDTKLTAHNQYLQIVIEGGIIKLTIFVFLLVCIWKLLINRIESFAAQLSACFFIGIIVYENFEMTLFQNNYSIALLQWLIITIGISFTKDRESHDYK